MDTGQPEMNSDIWSEWLLHRRHGNSAEHAQELLPTINGYANRVLDAAGLTEGMTLADIGSGEGLVAFGAVARIGASLQVILTDISQPMLKHAEQLAEQLNIKNQCRFVHCPADDLSAIPSASVDVVTTRSVLAYVTDKRAALREFYRILKPGGRISCAEPVFRDDAIKILTMKHWIDTHPTHESYRYMRLLHLWKSAQYPDTMEKIAASPLTNYTERDLFVMASDTGFANIHVELHIDSTVRAALPWEKYIECSPHPLAAPLSDILQTRFTPEDRDYFEQTVRGLLDRGELDGVERMVYLAAVKPV